MIITYRMIRMFLNRRRYRPPWRLPLPSTAPDLVPIRVRTVFLPSQEEPRDILKHVPEDTGDALPGEWRLLLVLRVLVVRCVRWRWRWPGPLVFRDEGEAAWRGSVSTLLRRIGKGAYQTGQVPFVFSHGTRHSE